MKPASAKSKGRDLQKWVRDKLLTLLVIYNITNDDIRSTSMGVTGEDVQLSPAVRKLLPIQIECKNRAKMAVYADYKQACSHGEYAPVLFIKQNRDKPLAVVDAEYFMELLTSRLNTA